MSADRTVFYAGCDLHESRRRVIEELLIALAEIAFSILVKFQGPGIEPQPVFQTAAAADIEVPANKTLIG
jgi:hypothetical protein